MATVGTSAAQTSNAPSGASNSAREAPASLPEYGWAYFDHVRAEYETLDDATQMQLPKQVHQLLALRPGRSSWLIPLLMALMAAAVLLWLVWGLWRISKEQLSPIVWLGSGAGLYLLWIVGSALIPLSEKRAPCPTWGDLFVLEYWLITTLPFDRLRVKAWDWRDRYHQIAGAARYQEYLKNQAYIEPATPAPSPTSPAPDAEALLRADLQTLVGELHRFYGLTAKVERKRTELSQLAGACLGVLLAATFGTLALSGSQPNAQEQGKPMPAATSTPAPSTTSPAAAQTTTTPVSTPTPASTPTPITPLSLDGPASQGWRWPVPSSPVVLVQNVAPGITPSAQSTLQPNAVTPRVSVTPRGTASGQAGQSTLKPGGPTGTNASVKNAGAKMVANAKEVKEEKDQQKQPLQMPLLAMVVVMGTTGALISMLRRLQSLSNENDPFVMLMGLERGGAVLVLLSTFSGAVFAILLALIFMGNFIDGALFPKFTPPIINEAGGVKFGEFFNGTQAKSSVDVAKMLVWAFIAGFAEQFVPDVLNRIVNTKPA